MKYELYDFDGTIYDGDSGLDFILFSIKKRPYLLFTLFISAVPYLLHLCSKEEFKTKLFSFLQDIEDKEAYLDEFWQKHQYKIKSFWLEKENHRRDIIISASLRYWLEPIANKYHIKALIATEYDLESGRIIGENCHGKEKVKRFYSLFPKGKIESMYTDSIHDLPLIEAAKHGYLVKKDKIYSYYSYRPNPIVRFWRWGWGIYHKNEEVWNYLIVGGLTTFVSIAVKWGLYFTILDVNKEFDAQLGVCVSWICAVAFAYIANRLFVFQSKNKHIFVELMHFVGARLLTLGMEMVLTYLFFNLLGLTTNLWVVLVTFIIQLLIMILNYVFSKLFVFKKGK